MWLNLVVFLCGNANEYSEWKAGFMYHERILRCTYHGIIKYCRPFCIASLDALAVLPDLATLFNLTPQLTRGFEETS